MSFSPVRIDGGGLAQVIDISPTGVAFIGSDTQGAYRDASATLGNGWQVRNKGIGKSTFYRQMAVIKWSVRETGVCYAGTGSHGANGGLLAWSETTQRWSLRSAVPQWAGNHAGTGDPLPATPRPAGRLLVQDAGSDWLFAGTYNQGVLRSANNGNDDFPVTCQMAGVTPAKGAYFCYALCQVPGTPTTIYGCFYDSAGVGAVWKCTNAQSGTPNFTKLANSPGDAQDIIILANGSIYVVAGNNGLYRSTTAADTTWTAKNGGTPTQAGGGLDITAGNSWWKSVDAYTDGSGNDQVLVACLNPIQPGTSTGYACVVQVQVTSGGVATFTNLTTTLANISNATVPPAARPFWNSGAGLLLGKQGWVNPQVRWDPNDGTHQKIYVTGDQGMWRSVNGGATWTIANGGMPQFLAHSIAVAPNKTLGLCDSDWGCFEVTDGDGTHGAGDPGITHNMPTSSQEGWGITYGPDSTAWLSTGQKYTNASGEIWTHPPGQPAGTWSKTGFGSSLTGAGGKVAIGLVAFNDATGHQILLAATWGSGMWRYAPTGTGGAYQWTKVSGAIGTTLPIAGTQLPVVYAGNGLVFCFDRPKGIWRSSDYGKTWGSAPIWAKTSTDPDAATIAVHPTVKGELWVSAASGLYQLLGADTGTVTGGNITPVLSTALPGKNGPIAFDAAGNLICALQDTGSGSGLVSSPDHGATWTDIVGDDSFAQCNCNPEFIATGPDSRIYVSGSNIVAQGFASSGGGQGTSAAFTEVQVSNVITMAGGTGTLGLWFSETTGGPAAGGAGLASQVGSLLVARIETSDGTATITPPAGWQLAYDIAAANTTGTTRLLQYHYLNNPGGLGGPAAQNWVLQVPPGLRRPAHLVAASAVLPGLPGQALTPGIPRPGSVILGGMLEAPSGGGLVVFTSTNTSATFKGRIAEYSTAAGNQQFFDASGTASAVAAATSFPVTAAAANTFTGGLATAFCGAFFTATTSGASWTQPGGWTVDGTATNNTTLIYDMLSQTGITAGPSTVTGTFSTSVNMTSWAAGIATYYALAATPVSVATTSCPNGTTGTAYSKTLAASGGVPPYAWALASGTLPTGLSLSAGGVISGTPSATGTFTFTPQVTDSAAQVASRAFTVTVATTLTVATTSPLPGATTGASYTDTLAAAGGTP